jgi:hypothetical protein
MNVVRKLLWNPEGHITTKVWNTNTTEEVPISFDMRTNIKDSTNLSLLIFVQDKYSKRILQSVMVKAPRMQGQTITGTEDPRAMTGLQIYPIPANGVLNIKHEQILAQSYDWQIVDQRGSELTKGKLNRDLRNGQSIDVTRLPNGIYFLRIQAAGKPVFYRKVAIMNQN